MVMSECMRKGQTPCSLNMAEWVWQRAGVLPSMASGPRWIWRLLEGQGT